MSEWVQIEGIAEIHPETAFERIELDKWTQPDFTPSPFRSGASRPVVALDIDGTLGDYHAHFLWFAERWLGKPMPSATDINPGLRLSEFMNIPHGVYKECKLAYRQGGLKRFMPAYPLAAELTRNIREAGVQVWICTSRPYLRLDNIDPDTREWLRRNGIEYDAVVFEGVAGETKYHDLVSQIPVRRIIAAVDDLPDMIRDAYRNGIERVYLRDQPYNRYQGVPGMRVNILDQLWLRLARDIKEWKEDNGNG
jgi:hypothetical protein